MPATTLYNFWAGGELPTRRVYACTLPPLCEQPLSEKLTIDAGDNRTLLRGSALFLHTLAVSYWRNNYKRLSHLALCWRSPAACLPSGSAALSTLYSNSHTSSLAPALPSCVSCWATQLTRRRRCSRALMRHLHHTLCASWRGDLFITPPPTPSHSCIFHWENTPWDLGGSSPCHAAR